MKTEPLWLFFPSSSLVPVFRIPFISFNQHSLILLSNSWKYSYSIFLLHLIYHASCAIAVSTSNARAILYIFAALPIKKARGKAHYAALFLLLHYFLCAPLNFGKANARLLDIGADMDMKITRFPNKSHLLLFCPCNSSTASQLLRIHTAKMIRSLIIEKHKNYLSNMTNDEGRNILIFIDDVSASRLLITITIRQIKDV